MPLPRHPRDECQCLCTLPEGDIYCINGPNLPQFNVLTLGAQGLQAQCRLRNKSQKLLLFSHDGDHRTS